MRLALLSETAAMALDTLRANKLRSALTVLGVVIGITSIVGMTALIRGFDESLRDSIKSLGPKTIFVARSARLSPRAPVGCRCSEVACRRRCLRATASSRATRAASATRSPGT